MKTELQTLNDRGVYELVSWAERNKDLAVKWVNNIKKIALEKIKNLEAHYVAKRFRQIERINYFDSFLPVISFLLVRFFFLSCF